MAARDIEPGRPFWADPEEAPRTFEGEVRFNPVQQGPADPAWAWWPERVTTDPWGLSSDDS